MEDSSREIVYPTVTQICDINRRMIKEFGGLFIPPNNFHNPGALDYILDFIRSTIYGRTFYPSLKEKANAIAYHIISRHVFLDGNKRTAIHIAWEFLRSNDIRVLLDSSIIDLSIAVANGEISQDELLIWFQNHQET